LLDNHTFGWWDVVQPESRDAKRVLCVLRGVCSRDGWTVARSYERRDVVTYVQKQIIAGLAFGSFASMLLVLFSIVTIPVLATAGVAAIGVGLGIFSACLVTMTWATQPISSSFQAWEMA
jgi:hypothetical protein